MNSKVVARVTCVVLALLGLVTSGYLLLRTVSLLRGTFDEAMNVCAVVFGSSCDSALLHSSYWSIGIPLPGWGLMYYGAMLYLLLMGWGLAKNFRVESGVAAFFLACAGAIASIVLMYLMFSDSESFCPLCLVVHAINFTLIAATFWLDGRGFRALISDALSGVRYLLGGKSQSDFAPWKMSAFVTCALLSVVIFEAVFIQVTIWNLQANAASAPSTEALLTAYNAAPIQEINVREDDPRIGSPEAPVQMVVFSDFQCPACKAFKKDLADVLSRHGDTTSVVFKHFPLDHACNDWVESEFHPMACAAAFATEAAREQGLFWPLHDLLFEAKLEGGVGQIRELAGKAGLNLELYDAAMNGDTGRIRVAEDIESGQALDMPGTPSIFINGKFLNSLSADSIGAVIESLVKDQ